MRLTRKEGAEVGVGVVGLLESWRESCSHGNLEQEFVKCDRSRRDGKRKTESLGFVNWDGTE